MIPRNRGLGIGRPVKDDLSAFPSHVGRASVGAGHYFRTVAGIFARLQTLAGGATRHPAGRAIWSGSTFRIGEGLVRGPSRVSQGYVSLVGAPCPVPAESATMSAPRFDAEDSSERAGGTQTPSPSRWEWVVPDLPLIALGIRSGEVGAFDSFHPDHPNPSPVCPLCGHRLQRPWNEPDRWFCSPHSGGCGAWVESDEPPALDSEPVDPKGDYL